MGPQYQYNWRGEWVRRDRPGSIAAAVVHRWTPPPENIMRKARKYNAGRKLPAGRRKTK